jgi:hypothetical protein
MIINHTLYDLNLTTQIFSQREYDEGFYRLHNQKAPKKISLLQKI